MNLHDTETKIQDVQKQLSKTELKLYAEKQKALKAKTNSLPAELTITKEFQLSL